MLIHDIKIGTSQRLDLTVKDLEDRMTKDGRPYINMRVSDGRSGASVKIWDSRISNLAFSCGSVISAILACKEYHGVPVYEISAIKIISERRTQKESIDAWHEEDLSEKYAYILTEAEKIKNPTLKHLTVSIVKKHIGAFLKSPAAIMVHNREKGDYLRHVYRMLMLRNGLEGIYKEDNHDLLTAGIIWHDIGRLFTLTKDERGFNQETRIGKLWSSTQMSLAMLQDTANKLGINAFCEEMVNMTHIVATHLLKPEWGAIRYPATSEAITVAMLDFCDTTKSKITDSSQDLAPGEFTPFPQPYLNNVIFYKAKELEAEDAEVEEIKSALAAITTEGAKANDTQEIRL